LTYPDIDTRCACLQVAARASSRSNSDTWCRFSYVCGRRERARAVSGGAWSSRANSGAFRLVRGAITGQESQSVRDHKKVRRKEKLRCRKAVKKTCLPAECARLANPTGVGRDPARCWLLRVYGRRSQRLSSRLGGWCAKLLLSHTSPSEVTPTPVNSPIRDDPSAHVT
jgi:hypothetical protein